MKHEVRIHNGYVEWDEANEDFKKDFPSLFGKYHHTFTSEKGAVSMIKLRNHLGGEEDYWEIFCIKGELFEDVERFDTKAEAMRRVRELLE